MTERAELFDMPGHLIRRLQQHATAVFQEAMRAEGHEITPVQFATMMALADRPGLDQAGLARVIAYDRATIGGVVKRLLEKGVISRVPAPDDRRAFRLELTRGGQSWLEELCPLVTRVQETILAGLSEDERAVFMTLMEKTLPATP
jgi:DNA-binding MarR family transcriptional regulator